MKKFSFIIVNYNGLEFLPGLVDSLNQLKFSDASCLNDNENTKNQNQWEVIFFDNSSTDGSLQYLSDICCKYDNFKLLKSDTNIGFCAGSNQSAKIAEGEYLIFLNPDTIIKTKDLWILYRFLAYTLPKNNDLNLKSIGVVGVKTLNKDGSLQYSCRSFPTIARQFYESYFLFKLFKKSKIFGSYFMTWWDHKSIKEVDWVTGSFLLIKKQQFFDLKGFDEDYFMYSEDTDLCLRLKKRGFSNYYFPEFEIVHFDSAIASRDFISREIGIWKSRRLYFAKNYSHMHAAFVSYFYFCGVLNRAVLYSIMFLFSFKRKNMIKAKSYLSVIKYYFFGSHNGKF